ncbi:DNA methyltransferase [Shinella sp. NM-101]|uniref:DNA methyltransferase n=1 Tax=Shinella sp. NM-101 TaxID=2744455 RepID=UPI00272C02D3|nr:DNA methyltransferase [Shinella sp. NM-101]
MSAPATFLDGRVTLHAGDCLDVLDALPEASVDAVVTDPPYHFDTIVQRFGKEGSAEAGFGTDGIFRRASAGFMGKSWDGGDIAFDPATWARVLRVLKPGGMLAAFSAPKCYHKMAFAIERAGFEMRDRVVHLYDLAEREVAFLESLSPAQADAFAAIIAAGDPLGDLLWTFGSGFPKGLDVAKAIDKQLGAQGEVVPTGAAVKRMIPGADQNSSGSWIKDNGRAYQPGSYVPATDEAERWDGWNIALKPAYEPIALARKPLSEKSVACQVLATGTGAINIGGCRVPGESPNSLDRWPANITHDGSDVVAAAFPDAPGQLAPVRPHSGGGRKTSEVYGAFATNSDHDPRGDAGSAARFFYTAKAKAEDRLGSGHPTVKPIDLMRWLCRMLCPPGGTILDPFAGTGTTGEAAVKEGFFSVLIEREAEYQADIARRMDRVFDSAARRRAHAIKVKTARAGVEPDIGPLFGTPGVAGGGGRPEHLRPLPRSGRTIGPIGLKR